MGLTPLMHFKTHIKTKRERKTVLKFLTMPHKLEPFTTNLDASTREIILSFSNTATIQSSVHQKYHNWFVPHILGIPFHHSIHWLFIIFPIFSIEIARDRSLGFLSFRLFCCSFSPLQLQGLLLLTSVASVGKRGGRRKEKLRYRYIV